MGKKKKIAEVSRIKRLEKKANRFEFLSADDPEAGWKAKEHWNQIDRLKNKAAGAAIGKGTAKVRAEIAHGKLIKKTVGRNPLTSKLLKEQGRKAAYNASKTNEKWNKLQGTSQPKESYKPNRPGIKVTAEGNPFKATTGGKRVAIIPSGVKNHIPGLRYKDKAGKISAITGSRTGKTYVRRNVAGPIGLLPIAAMFLQHLTGKDKKNG
jgi:hypothetical protein